MLQFQLATISKALKCAGYFLNSLQTLHRKYQCFGDWNLLTIAIYIDCESNKATTCSYSAAIVDFVTKFTKVQLIQAYNINYGSVQ